MSLPRSDYDPRRVCLNPFPFLDKLNLGKHRRTFGVYLAGGLVSPFPCFNSQPNQLPLVLARNLDISRRRNPLRTRTSTTQRAGLPTARACHIRRLGPGPLLASRYPSRQPYRQGPCARR